MNEEQTLLKPCPRCASENPLQHNFCWLCGLDLVQLNPPHNHPDQAPVGSNKGTLIASAGTGIFGVLVGALGGIAIGAMIVFALIMSVLNSIAESLRCGGMLLFMALAVSTAFYSILSWFF